MNRLQFEKSPYLLQHSRNPVDWFPWGEEAFEKARRLDCPIFLSIGYASCHWCHVMERESFEDPEIARLLNQHFVSIKVDREELPDVDALYMNALHAMGQRGGWPLSMFLDTDRRPFFGGTYFPPEAQAGMASFRQILDAVTHIWNMQRERVDDIGKQIQSTFVRLESDFVEEAIDGREMLRSVPSLLEPVFDDRYGGFLTSGPNKFPPSLTLMLLLRLYRRSHEPALLRMVERTLSGIRQGGIYDQVGGGIARYSTDEGWLVPHFEKMLYDNALFAQALIEAFRVTGRVAYRAWAEDVFCYIDRIMTSPDGVFYASEDADQAGEEGRYYLWSLSEVEALLKQGGLSAEQAASVVDFWGLKDAGNFNGKSILTETGERSDFASARGIGESELTDLIERSRKILLIARSQRTPPSLDDKILLSWNALMIAALARGGFAFDSPELTLRAEKAAGALKRLLFVPDRGWMRRYRDGEARYPALLSDLSLLALAYLDLYRVTGHLSHYNEATALAREITDRFVEAERIYETGPDPALFARFTDPYDGVQPSGPSAALQLFASLARYDPASSHYRETARLILRQFSAQINAAPLACCSMLSGILTLSDSSIEIVVTGETTGCGNVALQWIGRNLEAETILGRFSTDSYATAITMPLFQGKDPTRFGLYICHEMKCEQPLIEPCTPAEVVQRLERTASAV